MSVDLYTVTVITPSHRRDLLQHAMSSVFAQSMDKHKIQLLVDWAPTYNAEKINALASIARGKYLLPLCDDDKIDPEFCRLTVERAEAMDADIVGTDLIAFGDRVGPNSAPPWTRETFQYTTPCWFSSLIRRELWNAVGGFDPKQTYQDLEFYYRCFLQGARHTRIHKPLFHYRSHEDNGSHHIKRDDALALYWAKHPEIDPR